MVNSTCSNEQRGTGVVRRMTVLGHPISFSIIPCLFLPPCRCRTRQATRHASSLEICDSRDRFPWNEIQREPFRRVALLRADMKVLSHICCREKDTTSSRIYPTREIYFG